MFDHVYWAGFPRDCLGYELLGGRVRYDLPVVERDPLANAIYEIAVPSLVKSFLLDVRYIGRTKEANGEGGGGKEKVRLG